MFSGKKTTKHRSLETEEAISL